MQVNPNYAAGLAGAIATSTAQEQQLTSEMSSGLRVGTLSDDPVAVSANAQLAGTVSQLDSFVQSAGSEQSVLQVTGSALSEVVTQLTAAISLATQGGNGTLSGANLQSIAAQVVAIRANVLSLANTSYQGHYLFGGSQGATQPFTLDAATSPATATYAGDAVTTNVVTPGGQKLALNLPGAAVFQAAGGDVLGTLNQLVSDLQSGSATAIQTDTGNLGAALKNVASQQETISTSLSQLTGASSYAQTQEAQMQGQQSSLLAINYATVTTSLQTAEVQHQALISVVSALSQNDLFSYLK